MATQSADNGGRVPSDDEGPEGTRQRILAAARRIIVEEGYDRLALERVAERADVVRATIYYQFGSKSGLLDALVGAMELDARIHESRRHDHTFTQLLRRVTGLWEDHGDVLRSILAMATVDPKTGEVVSRHQQGRRQRIIELVEQIGDSGRLEVDHDDAVDLLWLLTDFQTYDFLRQNTSRDPDDVRGLLEMLAADVITSEPETP